MPRRQPPWSFNQPVKCPDTRLPGRSTLASLDASGALRETE
jgi:hypothetical protein